MRSHAHAGTFQKYQNANQCLICVEGYYFQRDPKHLADGGVKRRRALCERCPQGQTSARGAKRQRDCTYRQCPTSWDLLWSQRGTPTRKKRKGGWYGTANTWDRSTRLLSSYKREQRVRAAGRGGQNTQKMFCSPSKVRCIHKLIHKQAQFMRIAKSQNNDVSPPLTSSYA